MKIIIACITATILSLNSYSTVHTVDVWDGYYQFVGNPTLELGDTIQWLPLDQPTMIHTITSTNIPSGAATFDYTWQAPADTFFMYIPTEIGTYDYECTPHAGSPYFMDGSFEVVTPTSVEDDIDFSKIHVYPNPAINLLSVSNLKMNTAFSIISATGSTCLKGSYTGPIDVSNLPIGIYFIRFEGYENRAIRFIRTE